MKQNLSALAIVLFGLVSVVAGQNRTNPKSADEKPLPTLFVIGDSTVNNSGQGFQGWGNVIAEFFDTTKINIVNRARGGRSSKTFINEGLWDQTLAEIKKGDYVLMQFGHNDGGPIAKEKARGSLKGTGDETEEVIVETTGKREVVHTFGWYMRKYIADAKAKGAMPIVLSPVPRNIWKDGKVEPADQSYGKWAAESAKAGGAFFIDLNNIVAKQYEKDGQAKVAAEYFTTKDHTHTSPAGAKLNAASVIEGLRQLKRFPLKKYMLKR